MALKDIRSLDLTGATADAIAPYEAAIADLQCYRGDPVARVNAAIAGAPGFAMAHALKAWLNLLGTEPSSLPTARAAHARAAAAAGTPRDALALLALLAGHQIDFFTGHSRMLRDRIARALPAWDEGVPGFHSVLGMHAFGLEETGAYGRAEAEERRGVELEPRDGWSQHAVAHVLEMQSRQEDGIAWMRANSAAWATDSFFQVHNWWHLALYHHDIGDYDAVFALFDGEMGAGSSCVVLDMVDASALLWRLHLRGVDVGDRWRTVAAGWAAAAATGSYAFNDAHAVMAFVGAGRRDAALAVIAAQDEAMARDDDNAGFTRELGHAVARAILAFGDGDYVRTVTLLRPVRSIAHRFGGSQAQRDVIDLTLIEAAFRSGRANLAAALASERVEARHESPLSQLYVRAFSIYSGS
jgi:hypothetical protein